MRVSYARVAVAAAFLAGAFAASAPASAQSVMAACATDWKQAQAGGTTGGATWPQYLAQCKAQRSAAAAPAPAPAPPPPPAASQQSGSLFPWLAPAQTAPAPAAAGGQSVMAACGSQWRQAKADGTTGGLTWQQFLARCRGQQSASVAPAPAPTPAAAPAPAPAPAQQSGSLFPWLKPTPSAAAPTGAGQFSTEAEARYRCPSDTVVWINNESKIYHLQGSRFYGHTKKGGFMCEADAKASGARVSRAHQAGGQPG
jgi:hypothetical protein